MHYAQDAWHFDFSLYLGVFLLPREKLAYHMVTRNCSRVIWGPDKEISTNVDKYSDKKKYNKSYRRNKLKNEILGYI